MKLKLIEHEGKTFAEVKDGLPLVVEDDGKEYGFDFLHSRQTISRLNGESKAQREAREAAEAKLKSFDGIEDADAARKALETVRNLKEGELLSAGQVEEVKSAARRAAEEQVSAAQKEYAKQLTAAQKERDKYKDELNGERLSGAFANSKFIKERATVPPDIMQARFGTAFKIEEGRPVAYDNQGNKVYSRVKAGDVAEFDEALELLLDSYPMRDSILKGTQSSGSGARTTLGPNGQRAVSRSEFNRMSPAQQRETAMKGTPIVD